MAVYFAGSIRGGREDAALYALIVKHLQQKYVVLTEHVASDELTQRGEETLSEQQIHDRDMAWLRQSNSESVLILPSSLVFSFVYRLAL
jgi:2'-deoxynucleoside 5'-phosphate N-hydrolase